MKRFSTWVASLCLLTFGLAAQAAPVITFGLPDNVLVHVGDFDAYGVRGLALVTFQVTDTAPLTQMTAQGFGETLSVRLGGNTGKASGGLYWYTPVALAYTGPGEYDMTVTATDAAGGYASRTLHLFLLP